MLKFLRQILLRKKKIELVQKLQQFDLSFSKFLTEWFDEQFGFKLLL